MLRDVRQISEAAVGKTRPLSMEDHFCQKQMTRINFISISVCKQQIQSLMMMSRKLNKKSCKMLHGMTKIITRQLYK